MISDAVGLELLSRIVGYKLTKGDFSNTTPNLPMRVAIVAEANTANQPTLDLTGKVVTTAQEAGELYGYGSPMYHIMRILRPQSGTGIGGIPTVCYPQAEPVGATPEQISVTAVGVATANGTHTLKIAGRQGIDGEFYDININVGDDAATIALKMQDAVNNVLGSPVIALASPYSCEFITKWAGATAEQTNVEVLTNNTDLGITYAVLAVSNGSGVPSVQPALDQFGSEWTTVVVNGYGIEANVIAALNAFNGRPNPTTPTGRYAGIIFKPFIAITGSTDEDPSSGILASEKNEVTIAIAPAPKSLGYNFEAAANMSTLFARKEQDTPQLDVMGEAYPDMPTPSSIGMMSEYLQRDRIMKAGSSTVDLVSGEYVVQDFITTYAPIGELPPQFRYCRNLVLDWNVRFGYYILEQLNVVDHVIANDNDVINASKVIKPKRWKSLLKAYALDLVSRGLIADAAFFTESLQVGISGTNPDRLETFFRYKRTGTVRIASTTAEAGFNFGNS